MIKAPHSKRKLRAVAVFLLINLSCQIFLPTISYALTSGPSQPEFSSFEPVATTNMVDEFTGDFTYNLPVLEVPGPNGSSYPVSLSYHSGVTPEEEASWVGYGWTLNSGAITRNLRGIPDDYKNKSVTYHNKMPRNWTATTGGSVTCCEGFSVDVKLGFNASLRYNNYRGFGYNYGAGLYLGRGVVALGYNVSDGQGSFSLDVNPTMALNGYLRKHDVSYERVKTFVEKDKETGKKVYKDKLVKQDVEASSSSSIGLVGSKYGMFSYNQVSKPTSVSEYSGTSYNVSIGFQGNVAPAPIGVTANMYGSYSSQKNIDAVSPSSFGYLYSANAQTNHVMDYHLEKESDFNKRDVFLGVPFNDADNFTVTGEGIGGGFRLYNKTAGHFAPRTVSSGVNILSLGAEIAGGWTFGPGVDIGVGRQSVTISEWKKLSSFSDPASSVDEPVFFRFNNDLGGEWGSNHDDKPIRATISDSQPSDIVFGSKAPSIANSNFSFNNGERSGRSSYIAYNTNKGMMNTTTAPSFKSFNKSSIINGQADRTLPAYEELIGEISVVNETGTRYNYSLPVYSRNEKNLSFSVENASLANIDKNFLVYNTNNNEKVKVGYEQPHAYASTYLLTEINTPDFIDRSNDGPSVDDLGGYTRFNYAEHTTTTDWYAWRAPYRGLIYNKNSQSDPKDDQGTYSEGEKEIVYLQSIETKTHVAIFELEDREDSREAPSVDPLAKAPGTGPGTIKLKRLKRIDLVALEDCDRNGTTGHLSIKANRKAIKTVHFKYNYTLSDGSYPDYHLPNATAGKLTLERIYFEYNGVEQVYISPYIFNYNYQVSEYPSKYSSTTTTEDIENNVVIPYNTLSGQNPPYSPFNSDAWGNYQPNGQARFDAMQNWVDQKLKPNIDFDPAAWHLKVIKLPSGGEIHIQYEQDDYAFVQDQEVHVMAPLLPASSSSNGFYINTDAINVTDLIGKQKIVDAIVKRYKDKGNKIYFKFLYSLIGTSVPNFSTCNGEYITGYAKVLGCGIVNNQVYIELLGKLPQEVCKEFVKTQRLGLLDPSGNCSPGMNEGSGSEKDQALSIVKQLSTMASGVLAPSTLCQKISTNDSYFRIPTPNAKKGGGVRVKRLLMFDKATGLDGGPVLYGNEYLYQTVSDDGRIISSGVATNEPQTIREENVLVESIARKGQKLYDKIIAGDDKKQAEGPLGESIMPGPAIGYSKVTVKNIHSGKTSPGFSIHEFYTARDFPISLADPDKPGSMTSINAPSPEKRFLFGILVNIFIDKSWASQGFSFILNSMHGQVRSVSNYSGPNSDVINLLKSTLISRTAYEYFKPGEKVPVVSSLFGEVKLKNPGREVDITFANKKVVEKSYDANIEGDLEIAIIPLAFIPLVIIYPTAMPSVSFNEGLIATHATSKVVRYPAILKKTTIFQDGVLHTEENLAMDEWTGKPVVVKSLDEFKGAYLSQSIPASWEYPNYTSKATTEGLSLQSTTQQFVFTATPVPQLQFKDDGCTVLSKVVTGDVLELGTDALYQVQSVDYARDKVYLARVSGSSGNAPSLISSVKILRSGRTNELSESAGDVTFHNTNADNLNASSIRQPDSQRYVKAGNDANDGSLFIKDLTDAFPNSRSLGGPYHHMNVTQYVDRLPEGCSVDLTDASIKNVNIRFKSNADNTSIEIGTFQIKCSDGSWPLVRMPNN